MKPSIGRIVHFVDRGAGGFAYPGIISKVETDSTDVFLTVFPPHSVPHPRGPVMHEDDVPESANYFWRWPERVE